MNAAPQDGVYISLSQLVSDVLIFHTLILKQAEAIARKINLVLGETRESLAEKTGRCVHI